MLPRFVDVTPPVRLGEHLLDLPVGGAPSYNWENQAQRRRARTAVAALAGASPVGVPETQRLGHKAPQPMPALRIVPRE